jgi:hypothetical protein
VSIYLCELCYVRLAICIYVLVVQKELNFKTYRPTLPKKKEESRAGVHKLYENLGATSNF